MVERIPVTAEGLKKLQAKLKNLQEETRSNVERRLGEAREQGDLSENAEFDAAREELWRVDREITELKDRVNRAEIISPVKIKSGEVGFGSKVKLKDIKTGEIDEYTLVGEGESSPREGLIAITTPIGQALIGHCVGDKVDIKVPAGIIHYEIMQIN
ncbi:MAG: transcription elongation factor GreA [Planctomycetes bacterium]|nr:transcription elongation factor GreA [Planctomycetota bacterium]